MDSAVVSDPADDWVAAKVAEIETREDRAPDQIAAAALRLYVQLPESARNAWRWIEERGDSGTSEAAWAAGRALLNQQYERCLAEGLRNYKSPLPADASEQDIMDYAVEICRRR